MQRLCDELDNTTGLLDLPLGVLGEVAGADDEWDFWNAALAEDLGVAEGKKVENWSGVLRLAGNVLLALLSRDERPELRFVLDDDQCRGVCVEGGRYVPCRG